MPRGKSCAVSNCHVAKTMPNQIGSGAMDLFKTNFTAGMFFSFFCRDKNQNAPKLLGRNAYLSLKTKKLQNIRIRQFPKGFEELKKKP